MEWWKWPLEAPWASVTTSINLGIWHESDVFILVLFCFVSVEEPFWKMKVYLGSLCKREIGSHWGWSWFSKFLDLPPSRSSPWDTKFYGFEYLWDIQFEYLWDVLLSKEMSAQTVLDVAKDHFFFFFFKLEMWGFLRVEQTTQSSVPDLSSFVTLGKSLSLYRCLVSSPFRWEC